MPHDISTIADGWTACRRYFQSQGLFAVPTQIILVVAPINGVLTYALGERLPPLPPFPSMNSPAKPVWGPDAIRLGFIGAPIAAALSMNLISVLSLVYGVAFAPRTAWHPITFRSFTNLGILVRLGLGGVGQVAAEWWSWELVGRKYNSTVYGERG